METIVSTVRQDLIAASDEKTRESGQRFFKEPVRLHGVKASVVSEIASRRYKEISGYPKHVIFELCEELWLGGMLEEGFVACMWSHKVHKSYLPEDIFLFGRWISKYINNWATCDTLCNHSTGDLLQKYPEKLPILKEWAQSENRWMRRAAAVSLIVPARKGLFLPEILELADILLKDKDDMVQKGYGWMLKVAAGPHLQEVFDFIITRKAEMPRTALRYAIEKMPAEMKKLAMEK
jgi:3-methyladenine DNA glycosylase AlkD